VVLTSTFSRKYNRLVCQTKFSYKNQIMLQIVSKVSMFAHIQFSVSVYLARNLSHLGRVSIDLMINTIEGRSLLYMLVFFCFH